MVEAADNLRSDWKQLPEVFVQLCRVLVGTIYLKEVYLSMWLRSTKTLMVGKLGCKPGLKQKPNMQCIPG